MTTAAGQRLSDDMAALKVEVRSLRRDLDMQGAQQAEHTQRALQKIEEMSSALQEYNQSARTVNAEFGAQMEHMIGDVQQLRGAVEVNEHRLGQTEQSLAQRLDSLTKQAPGGSETSANVGNMPAERREALSFAAGLLKEGKLNDGRAAYRAILKQSPRTPGITDEAFFRLGESYFEEKRFDAALREYIRIVEKFGTGALVDDAYYKIGLCSLELGRLQDAQTFLTELVTNHRKSPRLRAAKLKLDEVNRRLERKTRARTPAPAKRSP